MADLTTIKNWFKTGLKPTQTQFWAWMDSFWHKDEQIPQSAVQNLIATLNAKAEASQFNGHKTDPNAHSDLFALKEDKTQKGVPNGYVPLNEFGKILSDYLVIVDDLITGGSASILSAEQGKELKTQIDAINLILTSDDVNLDTVQELVTAIKEVEASLGTILVNDLTTGGVTKALTAEMGKTLKGLVDALAIKPTSVQNSAGVEQFTTLDVLKFSNVSFNPATKTIEVNPLVPLSAFLDPINGSDINGVVENANRPFKTINALLDALPVTTGETYTIYITGGTINFTRKVAPRSLKWVAYSNCTLNFTNVLDDDGITHPIGVIRYVSPLVFYTWTYENRNISIACSYVGRKEFASHSNALGNIQVCPIIHLGTINTLNWQSVAISTAFASFTIGDGSDFEIINLLDSPQETYIFYCYGICNVSIVNFKYQYGRPLFKDAGFGATVSIANITQIGKTTFPKLQLADRVSKFPKLVLGNINVRGSIKTHAAYLELNGTLNADTNLDFTGTDVISGVLKSDHYVTMVFHDSTTIFRNFTGKLGSMDIYSLGKLIFENCNIQTNTYLAKRPASSKIENTVEFIGSNTLTQANTAGDLFVGNINIILNGFVKTNALSYGSNTTYQDISATFKEKLNEIVIRSKKDLVNQVLSSSTNYIIDGTIDDIVATDRIIVPVGGLSLSGYGFDVSALKATQNNSVLFESPVGGCGNLFLSNISLEASGTGSKVFNLTNAGAPTGGADAIELNVVNFDNCTSLGELTNFRQGLWDNIGVFGCKDGLTLSGTWSGGFRSDLVIVRNFGIASTISTLFKKGTSLLFESRFLTDINADFKVGGLLSNFDISSFSSNKLFQIKGAILTRNKVIDSTDNYTDTLNVNSSVCDWFGNIGLPNAGQVAYTDIEVNDPSKGLVLTSPDGTKFRMTVSDLGVTTITAV